VINEGDDAITMIRRGASARRFDFCRKCAADLLGLLDHGRDGWGDCPMCGRPHTETDLVIVNPPEVQFSILVGAEGTLCLLPRPTDAGRGLVEAAGRVVRRSLTGATQFDGYYTDVCEMAMYIEASLEPAAGPTRGASA
jgi:hypothetical protein